MNSLKRQLIELFGTDLILDNLSMYFVFSLNFFSAILTLCKFENVLLHLPHSSSEIPYPLPLNTRCFKKFGLWISIQTTSQRELVPPFFLEFSLSFWYWFTSWRTNFLQGRFSLPESAWGFLGNRTCLLFSVPADVREMDSPSVMNTFSSLMWNSTQLIKKGFIAETFSILL